MAEVKNKLFTVTLGGWYQRTTLHLSEIYDLFALGKSSLNLSSQKIKNYQEQLGLTKISRESGYLEYIKAESVYGITIKYYEDGLYVLETETSDIKKSQQDLKKYFDQNFNPAVSYIFSLGAPTPKILAEIETQHPIVVSTKDPSVEKTILKNGIFGEIYGKISSNKIIVNKTPNYIFISTPKTIDANNLIEMQIFFREFKDQLEKYLYIHRQIWEEISEIKEQKIIKGSEVEQVRSRLDAYQKTINLINSRINQMSTYINTRASICRKLELEDQLKDIFQYKFETLADTHAYIKELWKMTDNYLSTAIQVVVEVKNMSTNNSIQSLQIITTIGVLSGIIGYLSKDKLPSITSMGVWYFIILILITWFINKLIKFIYQNKKYELQFSQNQDKL